MRGRTGAALVVAAGSAGLMLAASLERTPGLRAAAAAPPAAAPPAVAIDWESARNDARSGPNAPARARVDGFAASNRDKIARVSIPVLLPGEPDLMQDLEIFPSGAFYSASASSRGMGLLITGSGRALATAAGHQPKPGVNVERSESGMEANFGRYGAAYSVGVDCRRPEDVRCTDPAYLRGLVARLVVVIPGGR